MKIKRKNSSYFCTLIDKTKSLETDESLENSFNGEIEIYILEDIRYSSTITVIDLV